MKLERHSKIVELIGKYEIDTKEELAERLREAGFTVTAMDNGKQRYTVMQSQDSHTDKYIRILQDGYLSMDRAQNILVIRTVPGMAMAVAASLDALHFHELVGCIAGDDTILCAVRSSDDTINLMEKIRKMIGI